MGKLCFSKAVKFFAFALLGAATAIAAIAVLSSPATAQVNPDGGGDSDDYPWDTDNLRYGSYTARTFGIPFHDYRRYATRQTGASYRAAGCGWYYDENGELRAVCWGSGWVGGSEHEPCQSGVADGFFQTVPGGRNDFPVLEITDLDRTESSAAFKGWGTSRSTGCDEFTAAQDRMVSTTASNGGYWLDDRGNLQQNASLPAHVRARPVSVTVGGWGNRGSGYRQTGSPGAYAYFAPSAYAPRVDIGTTLAMDSSAGRTSLDVPGTNWPGRTDAGGGVYWNSRHLGSSQHLSLPFAVGGSSGNVLCPAGWHPRGEDSRDLIGQNTGRTLTSLSGTAKVNQASQFWCRSDVRYQIGYKKQIHTVTCGASPRPACPSGVTLADDLFDAFGRVNCYYTFISLDTANRNTCQYYHPIPQCTDADTSTKREYTTTELATYTTGEKFPAKTDGTTECGEAAAATDPPADPPALAGFTANACVTASLVIYENRIAGSNAEPGVPLADRTLTTGTSLPPAWDLDVTSPHPRTASPPRDATAGTGDPDGCADGSESRADHSAAPAGAERAQNPAPAYASSSRTDSAAPPNDADGDIDYSGAAANMAHRYASKIAEHTCSVKLAEAEAELALLEEREAAFTQWLTDYKTAADSNAAAYGGYTKAATATSSGLSAIRFNDQETAKQTYADLLSARYASLSSALTAAKTAYDTATDRTTGSTRAAVIRTSSNSGCVSHYDREITRLKTLFASAETAALGTGASGISEEQNLIARTQLGVRLAIAVSDSSVPYSVPSLLGVLSRTETSTVCLDYGIPGNCWRAAPGQRCNGPFGACPGRESTTSTRYYTCPARSYSVSGAVSRTYKTTTRSASYSTTYTAAARSTESTSRTCPGWTAALTSGYSYAAYAAAYAYVMGTAGAASSLPSVQLTTAAAALRMLNRLALLGSYHPTHADRANLVAAASDDRDTAGSSLSVSVGSIPSGRSQDITDYQTAYKTAYDTVRTQAAGHMSGTAWESFDWRYETSTLAWGGYQEDPKSPPDGCDLINISADGTVTVEATRLDFETSSYGKGNTYGMRTDQQRTCKARRTRTPELLLMYAPAVISGTDTSKTSDSRLDTDTTATSQEFYYVDYQPLSTDERFKLYDEAEVFAVKVSLADRAPVLCYQPGEALVAHVGAKGIDAVNKAVFRGASGFAGGNKKHCYRHPSEVG